MSDRNTYSRHLSQDSFYYMFNKTQKSFLLEQISTSLKVFKKLSINFCFWIS